MPKTWLVTGCSSGLGEVFIQRILARGDKAIATTRGPVSRMSSLAEAGAKTYSLDVTASQADINAVVAKILRENGGFDVLVNNAGYIEAGITEEMSYEAYKKQFDTNFFGAIKATQAVLPHFREKKGGTIVIIGSIGGIEGIAPGAGAYCATKFALEGWHECLKQEISPFNISSMIFELGYFRTKVMHPDNRKFESSAGAIGDYDEMRSVIAGIMKGTHENQPGDPQKAVEVMLDVVKGQGVAKGKAMPDRLPIGKDALEIARKKWNANLKICEEWEDVISSTDLEG